MCLVYQYLLDMVAYDFNPTLKARSDGLFKMQRDREFSNWPFYVRNSALNLGQPDYILYSKITHV